MWCCCRSLTINTATAVVRSSSGIVSPVLPSIHLTKHSLSLSLTLFTSSIQCLPYLTNHVLHRIARFYSMYIPHCFTSSVCRQLFLVLLLLPVALRTLSKTTNSCLCLNPKSPVDDSNVRAFIRTFERRKPRTSPRRRRKGQKGANFPSTVESWFTLHLENIRARSMQACTTCNLTCIYIELLAVSFSSYPIDGLPRDAASKV